MRHAPTRHALLLVLAGALLIAGAATWAWRFDREMSFYGDDDASYLILGKAISLGRGYRMITDPLEPVNSLYPPGYPLLIAGVASLLGNPGLRALIVPVKVLGLVLYLAAVAIFLFTERRREGWLIALAAAPIFALHPDILRMSGEVMSEIPFLCFSLLGLLAFDHLIVPGADRGGWRRALGWLAAAVALAWPVYIRTIGLALPVAAVLVLAMRRRLREAVLLGAACALLLVPLVLQSRSVAGPTFRGTHLQEFLTHDRPFTAASSAELYGQGASHSPSGTNLGELVGRVRVAFWYYRRALPAAAVYTGSTDLLDLPIAVSFLGLALLVPGCVARLRADLALPELYVALYLCVLLLWPFHYIRLLVPLLPFLILYAVKGVEFWAGVAARLAGPGSRRAIAASAIVLACAFTVGMGYPRMATEAATAALPLEARPWPSWMGGYLRATVWISRNTPPNAVIFCLRPRHMSVVTGHKAGTYLVASTDELLRRIQAQGRAYIVEDVSSFAKQYLRPALDTLEGAGQAELVYDERASADTRIWLVRGERPAQGPALGAPPPVKPLAPTGGEGQGEGAPETPRSDSRIMQVSRNTVQTGRQPDEIPPRPPFVKGGWGDLVERSSAS